MIDSVVVNDHGAAQRLRVLSTSGAQRALRDAIMATLTDVQKAERTSLPTRVKFRNTASKSWGERSVKITQFPKREVLRGAIGIQAPGDPTRSDILGKLEEDSVKRPTRGDAIAINEQQPFKSKGDWAKRRPKALNLRLAGKSGATQIYFGDNGTFMIKMPGGQGGIYQRSGRKVKGERRAAAARLASDVGTRRTRDLSIRTLYRFTPFAEIGKRLHFEDVGMGVVRARFSENLAEAIRLQLNEGRGAVHTEIDRFRGNYRRIAKADIFDVDRVPRRAR